MDKDNPFSRERIRRLMNVESLAGSESPQPEPETPPLPHIPPGSVVWVVVFDVRIGRFPVAGIIRRIFQGWEQPENLSPSAVGSADYVDETEIVSQFTEPMAVVTATRAVGSNRQYCPAPAVHTTLTGAKAGLSAMVSEAHVGLSRDAEAFRAQVGALVADLESMARQAFCVADALEKEPI